MLELLDILHPLSQFAQEARVSESELPRYFTEFSLIYLLLISLVTLFTGRLGKKAAAIAVIPTLLIASNLTSFITAYTSISNPQTLYSYPLMVVTGLLIISATFKRTRTMARLWVAIMASAVVVGASLIHISAISIKLASQNYSLAETNLLIADSNFKKGEGAENAFFTMCYKRQVYCRTSDKNYVPNINRTSLDDVDAFIVQVLDSAGLAEAKSGEKENLYLLSQVNEPLGAPYQILSVYRDGIERTIIDFNRVHDHAQEAKAVIYIWMSALMAFWVWGGLIGYYWHANKKRKYKI
ncbi:hypothetical protein [Vibrio crassostreae]|uniref:hypothetical protein n=1 Tax=Vibrio crassostreae TaxID=246167 RepID=UPI001B302A64|nr:hypothetical protein [Vibrio crassostreae]